MSEICQMIKLAVSNTKVCSMIDDGADDYTDDINAMSPNFLCNNQTFTILLYAHYL